MMHTLDPKVHTQYLSWAPESIGNTLNPNNTFLASWIPRNPQAEAKDIEAEAADLHPLLLYWVLFGIESSMTLTAWE